MDILRDNRSLPPLVLPPTEELLWELAIWSRALRFIQNAAEIGDRDGIMLSARLAYLLHNGPERVVECYCEVDCENLPSVHDHRNEVAQRLRPYLLNRGISEAHFPVFDQIFSPDDIASELGVNADLSNVDLAPGMKFRLYNSMLRWACIVIRKQTTRGDDTEVTERDTRLRRLTLTTARLLQPIPRALVHWSEFDERAFRRASCPNWNENSRYLDDYLMIFRRLRRL